MIDDGQHANTGHCLEQIGKLVKETLSATLVKGRAFDKWRVVVRTQVMVMAFTQTADNESPSGWKLLSANRLLFETVEIAWGTGKSVLKAVSKKRQIIMDEDKETLISSGEGFWQRISDERLTPGSEGTSMSSTRPLQRMRCE